ncbi:MAG: glycosyltransferase [Candidatus Riflebacteria bacterium HGW-Riflebacteria-1]|nr:MAG: glycosyltransferase [Candidatus Riflebacteria bacterium HGW-Riflebacteria-1]
MQIAYDNIIFSLQKAGGASMYWHELIKRLQIRGEVSFFEKENSNIFRKHLTIQAKEELCVPSRVLRYFPFTQRLPSKSIFHSSLYRVSIQKNIVNITTVYDFTYEYFVNGLPKFIHSWQKGYAVRHSDGLICISENTKRDLLKFRPHTDESKIRVIYIGVSDDFFLLQNKVQHLNQNFECLQNKKYIVFVGDRSPYKNFDLAVKALQQFSDLFLVIVGGKPFNQEESLLMSNLKDRVFHFAGIDSSKLNILYNNAFCLVYPSSYEGFGIPVVEAMKSGCPVVTTGMSSIPEVAGIAGVYINKLTPDGVAQSIASLKNLQFREEVVRRGFLQAAKFSWDKCFEETYAFYEEIYNMKFGNS